MPAMLPQHQIDELRRTWRPVTSDDLDVRQFERDAYRHINTANLDVDRLIATGAMEGPYTRTKPVTLSVWCRMVRWARSRLGWLIYR